MHCIRPSFVKDLHCCSAATLGVWSEVPNSPRRSGPTEINQGLRKNRKLRTPTSTFFSCWKTFWAERSPTLHTHLCLSNRLDVRCHVVFVSFLLSDLTLKMKRWILLSSLGNAKCFSWRAGCISGEAGRLTVIVSELKYNFGNSAVHQSDSLRFMFRHEKPPEAEVCFLQQGLQLGYKAVMKGCHKHNGAPLW